MESTVATRSNLQVIQQAFADFQNGNITAILDACTDDVVWSGYKVPGVDFTNTMFGKDGVQEFFTKLGQQVDFLQFETKEFISQGDRVVVLGHNIGTIKSTGKTFSNEFCFSFKMRDGKVQNYFSHSDSYDLFRAYQ
jgi:uncharacterized protein